MAARHRDKAHGYASGESDCKDDLHGRRQSAPQAYRAGGGERDAGEQHLAEIDVVSAQTVEIPEPEDVAKRTVEDDRERCRVCPDDSHVGEA